MKSIRHTPLILCILDGWGSRDPAPDNAITQADTPNWDRIVKAWPSTVLQASGEDVGLPAGQMGNSEVGHMNIGAGRVVLQDLPRINEAIAQGSLQTNPKLKGFCQNLKHAQGTCHLLGLLSPGGVHSHQDHLVTLARTVASQGIPVMVHAFLDGRDTPPRSALEALAAFEDACGGEPRIQIGSVSGRFYGMDRDNRWDRTEAAYRALVEPKGLTAPSPQAAIEASYAENISDEFVKPTVIADYAGMRDGDGLLMANFRADRVRQLLSALCAPYFEEFARPKQPQFSARLGMVSYSTVLNRSMQSLFPPVQVPKTLGEIVSEYGLNQLRVAETEKYAHVTFFFNGGREPKFIGEDRILVPSPKVSTYDFAPQMAAEEITTQMLQALERKVYDFVVINYANPDMVGHTGNQPATIQAIQTMDKCLEKLEAFILKKKGLLFITADHGNAETMQDPKTGKPHTAHTCEPVPFVLVSQKYKYARLKPGKLADIAPTALKLMGLEVPGQMTGSCLIENKRL